MKLVRSLAFPLVLCAACSSGDALSTSVQADTGCIDGADSYIDEYGDVVECVYTDTTAPDPDPCVLYPELCYPTDECDIDPSLCSGSGGTGDPGGTVDPTSGCSPPSTSQDDEYQRAKRHALCALQVPRCAIAVETPEQNNPFDILSTIDLRGNMYENCPTIASSTDVDANEIWIGDGANASIYLRPGFYDHWTRTGKVMILLHELGHATGRIASNHIAYYDSDPTNEQAWDDRIDNECIDNADITSRCGAAGSW